MPYGSIDDHPPKLIIAYPLVICDIAIENGPFLVDLPFDKW